MQKIGHLQMRFYWDWSVFSVLRQRTKEQKDVLGNDLFAAVPDLKSTRLSYWTNTKTKREGTPQCSQIRSFLKPASLVMTVKDTHIYLGSGYNAVQAKFQEDQWSLRINCAGTELTVPGAYALPLEDTNNVKLTEHKQMLDRIAFLCSDIIDAKASSNVEEYPKDSVQLLGWASEALPV